MGIKSLRGILSSLIPQRVRFSLSDPPFLPGDLLKLEGGDRVEEYFL
jgi:hypothetical protein